MANNKDFKVKNGIQPTVYHEAVGTSTSEVGSYLIGSGSYSGKSKDISTENDNPQGLWMREDNGTDFYMLGTGTNDVIYQYSLSTAFDISTATAVSSKTLNVAPQTGTDPTDFFFKSDGTKLYVCDQQNVYQYALTTAWDLSTASFETGKTAYIGGQETANQAVAFSSDGTRMFIVGSNQDNFSQYNLSTAWDVSTATYSGNSLSITETSTPSSIRFNDDGTKVFIIERTAGTESILQYSMTTAYDVSTMSYDEVFLTVADQEGNPYGLAFGDNGTKIYVAGSTSDTVYQYDSGTSVSLDLSTGSVFEITPTSNVEVSLTNPAASGTVSQATLLLEGYAVETDGYDLSVLSYDDKMLAVNGDPANPEDVALSTDGTKMYVLYYQSAGSDDNVTEYDLSTAWDVSTGTYSQEYSVNNITNWPEALTFKPDGTAFFLGDSAADMVKKVPLSTAWDISTATTPITNYETTVLVNVSGIAFKPDGTEMYITGQRSGPNGSIQQISMTTAWDLSTASSTQIEDVTTQTGDPWSISISDDGTTIIIMGTNDDLYEYTLSTAWDLSTISYASVTKSLSSENLTMHGIHHRADGVKMYAVGWANDHEVHQYTSGTETAAVITYDSSVEFSGGTAPTSPDVGDTDVITFSTRDGGTTYQAIQAIDGAK